MDIPAVVEHLIRGLGDGHLYPGLLGQRTGVGGSVIALYYCADLLQCLRYALSLTDQNAIPAVS